MMPTSPENDKPVLAVSSCLLGYEVRYDGRQKLNHTIVEELGRRFDFFPVCPEIAIGLGVPREPVQLVDDGQRIRAIGRVNNRLDISDKLTDYASEIVDDLSHCVGYIFKSRSPSCGLYSTPVYDSKGRLLRQGAGLFASALRRQLVLFPCIEESALEKQADRERFIAQVYRNQQHIN